MNLLIINGSPRKSGRTATIANVFGEAASARGASVRTYNLNDMRNIRGCQSCTKCWEAGRCVVEDDFAPALADHNWADIIVWATPVYVDDMSGVLKLFTDRMLFSNANIIEPVRKCFCKFLQTGSEFHGSSDRHDPIILFCQIHYCITEY